MNSIEYFIEKKVQCYCLTGVSRKRRPKTDDPSNEDPLENEDLENKDPLEILSVRRKIDTTTFRSVT